MRIEQQTAYIFSLTAEEARILRAIMQNPSVMLAVPSAQVREVLISQRVGIPYDDDAMQLCETIFKGLVDVPW